MSEQSTEDLIRESLKQQYFRLIREERIGHTLDITSKLDLIEKAMRDSYESSPVTP